MVLLDLEEMENSIIHLITIDEILARWTKIGLLEGLEVENRSTIAIYLESTLLFMQENDMNKFLTSDNPVNVNDLNTLLFPMIRRLYSNNKLELTLFQRTNEDHRYLSLVEEFTNKICFKPSTEIQNIMYDFYQFLPLLIKDFDHFCVNNYKSLLTLIPIDIEVELLSQYCDQFNIEKLKS